MLSRKPVDFEQISPWSLSTLLQKTTEDGKRGRVMSFVNMGAMAAMPIAYGITVFLLEQLGPIPLILGIGFFTLIGSTACFRSREIMAAN